MSIVITKTFFATVVGPGEIVRAGVGFYAGERLRVLKDYDQADGCDWLKTRDGLLVAVPDDGWRPAG